MIIVDDHDGSKQLLPLFPPGSAMLGNLAFGDFGFAGNGPSGTKWGIGVERKTLSEMLESVRGDARFVDVQLPGMIVTYQRRFLVVEGAYRQNSEGLLESAKATRKQDGKWETGPYEMATAYTHTRKPFHARELAHHLQTIREQGIEIVNTVCEQRTAEFVYDQYTWWTGKEYDKHRSHLKMYTPPLGPLAPRTWLWRMVANGPDGVGERAAEAFTVRFGTIEKLVMASEEEIANATYKQEVKGEGGIKVWKERRVGEVAGKKVWKELRGLR